MLFERIMARGISHNSYIIGAVGKAVVIDPRRDCEIYLEIARKNNYAITHIFETHRNEDYVTGSLELQTRCGAEIFHGTAMNFSYGKPVHEGDIFNFGPLSLTILETPGHTEESITLVLRDQDAGDTACMVFCGDTLFSGDIARTDFFGEAQKEEMAAKIYDSIAQKILPLGDGAILCPAHGAGSICGGDITDHPFSTIGYERATNPHLLAGKDRFIEQRKTESLYIPPYFRQMEHYNKEGAPLLHHLPIPHPASITEARNLMATGCQILDIRGPTAFAAGHIPGSISIWREGISAFAGWILSYDRPILIIDDFNQDIDDVVQQLIRLGYDNIAGILNGGFPAWTRAAGNIGTVQTCSVWQLKDILATEHVFLLDVRDSKNRNNYGYITGSHHIYAGELAGRVTEIPRDIPVYIYCDSGYKGSLAASILALHDYPAITNVLGGMTGWINAGFTINH